MENNNTFVITIPTLPKKPQRKGKTKDNNVEEFKESIKSQYNEIISYQDVEITKENKKDLENLIFATEDLISNCMDDEIYCGNRDQYFVNLIYVCHKLSLRIETYKLEEKIQTLVNRSHEIAQSQQKLEDKQTKAEEQSNNLIYNILGFIASFSVVSAAVTGIANIQGTVNIILFMTFCAFILITTLIGLNNFYKNNREKNKNPLKNNYFLWWMLLILLISGVQYIKNNKEEIWEVIEKGQVL